MKDLLKEREENGEVAKEGDEKLTELEEKDKEMLKKINFKVIACDYWNCWVNTVQIDCLKRNQMLYATSRHDLLADARPS